MKSDPNQWPPIVGGGQRSRAAIAHRHLEAGLQRSEDNWHAAVQASYQRRRQSAWLVLFRPEEGCQCQTSMQPIRSCKVDEQGKFLVKAERYRLPMTGYLRCSEQA